MSHHHSSELMAGKQLSVLSHALLAEKRRTARHLHLHHNSTQKITDVTTAANSADLDEKVDKVSGKGLSTNDFTTAEKTKLDDLAGIKSIGTGLSLNSAGKLTATGGGGGDGEYAVTLTPEQYGAVGDGTTDDTQAFQDMFDAMYAQSKSLESYYNNNGTPTQRGVNNVIAPAVTLTSGKEYKITDTVHIKSPACRIIGNNAKIKSDNQNRVLGFDVFTETVNGQTVNFWLPFLLDEDLLHTRSLIVSLSLTLASVRFFIFT